MRRLFTGAAVLLLLGATAATAQDDDAFHQATASVGGHYTSGQDEVGRVGEYVRAQDVENILPDARVAVSGGDRTTLYDILMLYRDRDTQKFGFDLDTGNLVSVSTSFSSFSHNLDHDLLANINAREAVWNTTVNDYRPGGKMAFHEDLDPLGRYAIRYRRFGADVEGKLPFLTEGAVYGRYTDQRRQGWKQINTIDHCAFCHVSGNRKQVDEVTQTWRAGARGRVAGVAWNYEFGATDWTDRTTAPQRRWDAAMHPVFGNIGPTGGNTAVATPSDFGTEFSSRVLYDDVTLPYARGADSEKRDHAVRAKYDFSAEHALRGAWTHATTRNTLTRVEGRTDAWAASWAGRIDRRTRATARLMGYQVKVDDVLVDLPPWRDGRAGGGQDFDWTRISAANREVLQADVTVARKLGKGGSLTAGWRHQVVDRDAMAISQVTYVPQGDGTVADLRVPSAAFGRETTLDRFELSLAKRLGMKGRASLRYAYTNVDLPYMNPTALCEEGLEGANHNLDGNTLVWYFQRERYGNGTNQPSRTHRADARASYQLSSRASLSGSLNLTFDENDDLNVYHYWRTVIAPAANFWVAPDDRVMLAGGWTWQRVESNAVLCPPIFDG